MMIKRRLFLTYVALGLVLIFFVYSLNTIYVDRYEIDDTAPADLSADVRPPNPFPQGKPDLRKKKQEEEERLEKEHEADSDTDKASANDENKDKTKEAESS